MSQSIDRELQITADGSHTLFVPALNEHYHSVNGAVQESLHIFIGAGLRSVEKQKVRILEIGFGTGLNAFLTLKEQMAEGTPVDIEYYSVELYPLSSDIVEALNYGERIWPERRDLFMKLHTAEWNASVAITDHFLLYKIEGDSNRCELPDGIDLIYFDAFAPDKQPEMWSSGIFARLYALASKGAVIVTYCAKGEVRRRMQAAGFNMQRLPGPPGKRHILRGIKE